METIGMQPSALSKRFELSQTIYRKDPHGQSMFQKPKRIRYRPFERQLALKRQNDQLD